MKKFKRHRAMGLFDADLRIENLITLGDPLYRLAEGRPPYDYVMMFKIRILQRYFNSRMTTWSFRFATGLVLCVFGV